MAKSPIQKLLQKDPRIYAFALILVMLIILIYFFVSNINNNAPQLTPTGVVIYQNENDGITVNVEREISEDEKDDIRQKAADITSKDTEKINVEVANPYVVNEENQEIWETKVTQGQNDQEIYTPSPDDIDPYNPNEYKN